MNILVLNGSPRLKGNTKQMVNAFQEGAESAGHQVDVSDICKKRIAGCLACEYCHTRGKGVCVQKDDMQEVYDLLNKADMPVLHIGWKCGRERKMNKTNRKIAEQSKQKMIQALLTIM